MSRLNCAKKELNKTIERYDEMFEDEPSHENMFDVGQDVVGDASSLALEVAKIQAAWVQLTRKWNPESNKENPTRLDFFVKEFEQLLLPKKKWVFNTDEI